MTTAGYSLSPDEIAGVCGRLRARIDDVGDLRAQRPGGELTRSDLGGAWNGDLVSLYEEVVRHKVPGLLREYQALGHDLANRLESTLSAYRRTDSAVADALGSAHPYGTDR